MHRFLFWSVPKNRNRWNRLEPKPEPIGTDWNRNRNRSEPIGTETGTDQNRNRNRSEPIGTETGTDQNRLEPKPEPIRTDWNRNRNRSEPIGTETGTDQNRSEPIGTDWNRSEQVEVGTRNKMTLCTEKSEKWKIQWWLIERAVFVFPLSIRRMEISSANSYDQNLCFVQLLNSTISGNILDEACMWQSMGRFQAFWSYLYLEKIVLR